MHTVCRKERHVASHDERITERVSSPRADLGGIGGIRRHPRHPILGGYQGQPRLAVHAAGSLLFAMAAETNPPLLLAQKRIGNPRAMEMS